MEVCVAITNKCGIPINFKTKRKPDLFITITCDTNHEDIQNELPINQKVDNRPDMVARVFKQHLEETTDMLIKGIVPGWEIEKNVEVVDFQKVEIPHAHTLVTLNISHSITELKIEKYCEAEILEVLNERD